MTVTETGTRLLLNGESRRYLHLAVPSSPTWFVEWIEGIGDTENGLLPAFYDFEGYDRFICARDESGELWQYPAEYWKCDSLLCAAPIAAFEAAADEKTLAVKNNSLNAGAWLWEFGDGQTSTQKNPAHTYSDPGCYTVCLTAYSGCLQNGSKLCWPVPVCVDPAWKQLSQVPTNAQSVVDIDFVHPDTGWALSTRSIWKTTDGGLHWTEQIFPQAPAPTVRILIALNMLDAQKGIIACGHYSGNGGEKAILVTDDGGQSWQERADGSYFLRDALLTPDGQGFACGQFRDLIYSGDGGANWVTRDLPGVTDLTWFQYLGNDTLYAFGYQGLPPQHTPVFLKSFDSGLNWEIIPLPGYPAQTDAHFLNTRTGWAVGDKGFLIQTTDGGQSWQPHPFDEPLGVRSVDFADGQTGWAVGAKGLVLHTSNGGAGWQRENCGYLGNMSGLSVVDSHTAFGSASLSDLLVYHPGTAPDCSTGLWEAPTHAALVPLILTPNPAGMKIKLDMPEGKPFLNGDRILIFNTLGQLCIAFETVSETAAIDVSTLPGGCYALLALRANLPLARGRFVKR